MLSAICEMIATALDVIFMVWFVPQFFDMHFWDKPWTLTVAGGMLAFQLIFDQLMNGFELPYVIGVVAFVYLFAFLFSQKQYMKAIFVACLFFGGTIMTSSAVYCIFNIFVENASVLWVNAGGQDRVLMLISGKLLQYSALKFITSFFTSQGKLTFTQNLFFVLHTVLTTLGLATLFPLSILGSNNKLLISLMAAVLIIINVIVYWAVNQLLKLQRNKYELMLLHEKMEFEKIRSLEVGAIWDEVRKTRHDLKNHLLVMRGQLQQGNAPDCEKYVNELIPIVKCKGKIHASGNDMLDYLINTKLQGLKDTEILISGTVNNQPQMEDVDLVCILGHILEDAVKSLASILENKRIEIHFYTKRNMCMIVCKYSAAEQVRKQDIPRDRFLEFFTEKYNGMLDRFYKDDMFCVQIVLPQNA